MFIVATKRRNEIWQTETSLWGDVVSKSPNKQRPHDALAAAYAKIGDNQNSIRVAEAGLLRFPEDQFLYVVLGNAYMNAGMPDKGLAVFRKAVDVRPDTMNAYNLGGAYLRCSPPNLPLAAQAFRRSMQSDPRNLYALDSFINTELQLEAHTNLEPSIRALKSPMADLYLSGKLAANGNDWPAADHIFSQINPSIITSDDRYRTVFYFMRAAIKDQLRDAAGAAALYRMAVQSDPTLVQANYALAVDLINLHQYAEARKFLMVVLTLDPSNHEARSLYQRL